MTPNFYYNSHDTNITVSCNWIRSFVEPWIAELWAGKTLSNYYEDIIEVPDALHPL